MSTQSTYFVRIKPYNKRRGYLCRNFMVGGVRFSTRWTEVSAAKAQELETYTQPHAPLDEIPLFDVKSKDEAQAIEQREREAEHPGTVHAVKSAERVPDRAFRDDRPQVDPDTGEIIANVEAGEAVDNPDDDFGADPAGVADIDQAPDADPAPSLRGSGKGRAKART